MREECLGLDSGAALARRLRESPNGDKIKGASSSSVWRYELPPSDKAFREAPPGFLKALAGMAQVDPGWLLTGEGLPDREVVGPDAVEAHAAGVREAIEELEGVMRRLRASIQIDEWPDLPDLPPGALVAVSMAQQRPPLEKPHQWFSDAVGFVGGMRAAGTWTASDDLAWRVFRAGTDAPWEQLDRTVEPWTPDRVTFADPRTYLADLRKGHIADSSR